ncbi:RNA polymerase ECF-type sigma factor [Porphyromonas crevioricanis JCM 15906]|uniref:RNA polymerase ECF-type sigma factor n=1 Tax=Porphyromonas crevioricanis JCM 15906 TaxID=1305617 RepID=S4PG55_9PORP|nr:RNA polymerase sigma factor [Porphyromonas crevioricanis]GAD04459.1 RNA polymerase ECF-type sigma factor [Porphyromonas crevioricanis JCM 15906]SJZ76466.1 RNA polymerase sigma-70 factor, ECF subfamily [Porphyromonas crevioricanis]
MGKLGHSEADLLERLRKPDTKRAAFAEVVESYSERIYWQVRRMVHNHDDADDMVQNTFLKAWAGIDDFRGDALLSTWLYRIAMYECLAFLKKNKLGSHSEVDVTDENAFLLEQALTDPYFDGDEAEALFAAAIAALPDKQRLVFTLRYYEDMPYSEISRVTGTSEGALKASYHHASRKIESFLRSQH